MPASAIWKNCASDPDYYYKRNTKTNKKGDFNVNKFNKIARKFEQTIAAAKLFRPTRRS